MKRFLAIILSAALTLGMAGCGSAAKDSADAAQGESAVTENAAEAEDSAADEIEDSIEKAVAKTTATSESDGILEGEKLEGMAESITAAVQSTSFDVQPFGGPSGARDWFGQNLYAKLFYSPTFGATLDELQPWIAESVTKVDDVTYEVKLRDYVTDNKGNAITADDVIWSYEMSATYCEVTDISNYVDTLEKLDDYNIRIHLIASGPGIIEAVLSSHRISIVDKEWYEGADDEELTNDPAVTGPYRIVKYIPGSQLRLEAVEDYWLREDNSEVLTDAAKQNVKIIEYKVIKEPAMRSIAMENGELDVCQVSASELQRFYLDGEIVGDWNVFINGGSGFDCLMLNMDSGKSVLADNADLRKAILYAISPDDILFASGANYDLATPCEAFATPVMNGYQDKWEQQDYFDYDMEKAQEYLTAAGYKPGELTLRLLTSTGNNPDARNAVVVAELEAIGINVELSTYDQALFNTYKYDSSQWDMLIDTKSSSGHVVSFWDSLFNPEGYSNGGVNFVKDDHLTELVLAANKSGSEEDVDALHSYINELAMIKGFYWAGKYTIAQEGILTMKANPTFNPCLNAYEFAADYEPTPLQ